jgi:BlaI family transcriptional regulator, penicillinase repressor
VHEARPDAPGYSGVRATPSVLMEKGYARHKAEGLKYVYLPVVAREKDWTEWRR